MFEITARSRSAPRTRSCVRWADFPSPCRYRRISAAGDAAQIGITPQTYQQLPLSPAIFRKLRTPLSEGEPEKYELMVSASAIEAQVGALELTSADALFAQAAGVSVNGKLFLIEAVAAPEAFGQAYLYRMQLREALPQDI